jgi:hypothetical protein
VAKHAKRQTNDAEKEKSTSLMDRLAALAKEFEQEIAKRKHADKRNGQPGGSGHPRQQR